MNQLESIRRLHKKLGIGARGVVYLGFDDDTGAFVAIKEISFVEPTRLSEDEAMHGQPSVDEPAQVLRELRVMQQIHHERLVAYLGARRSVAGVEILMEYVGGGSLERLLRHAGPLREAVARRYVRDMLEGLCYLHDTVRVCHRDIKPGNILLTPDGRCKLTDFGASAMLAGTDSFMQTTVGTPWYMAPEVIHSGSGGSPLSDSSAAEGDGRQSTRSPSCRSRGYTTRADIWSLGVTLFEMLTGEKPFGGQLRNTAAVMFAIVEGAATPPALPPSSAASADLQGFLRLCLTYDRRQRPTAAELLRHAWLAAGAPAPPRATPPPKPAQQRELARGAAAGAPGGAAAAPRHSTSTVRAHAVAQ
ncbi:mitogen-activated protein kinase kinase kinase 2 [Strigomonas culicis]|uniref:Mitogen-activated protein kinase kinase kinase 2 n=1 Tax=Strigomonas culicis TaxID=28005 RepID=S9W5C1_9TRYP|nr:mitogen-activated protein kinase kinase kinase 2 [Strigomonas culicis]|eukprot:EPY31075.1 mitogen-activated protein kinase kinase kinase 2 [Strigomonas culicis]